MNKPIAIMLVMVIGAALIGGVLAYETWMDYTGKAEIRRLEAAASVADANAREAEALAEALRNQAELERAMGEHALKKAEGEAIKAPAQAAAMAVRMQALIVGFWTIGGPIIIGVLLGLIAAIVAVWVLKERTKHQYRPYVMIDKRG